MAREFLAKSIFRDQWRRRRAITILSVLLVLALTAAGIAYGQRQAAQNQQRIAQNQQRIATARALSLQAESLRDAQPVTALRLGIAANRIGPSSETRNSLATTLLGNHYAGTLAGHTKDISTVALSPDGRLAFTAGFDNKFIIWGLNDQGEPRQLAQVTTSLAVTSVAVTKDSRLALTGGLDQKGTLWDVRDPARPHKLSTLGRGGQGGTEFFVALSSDGRIALTGGIMGTVTVWDISDPARPRVLSTLPSQKESASITSLAMSGDGQTVLTSQCCEPSPPGIAVWEMQNPAKPHLAGTLPGTSMAISTDGHVAAIGMDNGTATLWDLRSPNRYFQLGTLSGQIASVTSVTVSEDGKTALTGGADGTTIVWDLHDLKTPRQVATLGGLITFEQGVALDSDGRHALTASSRTALSWNLGDVTQPIRIGTMTVDAVLPRIAADRSGTLALTGGFEGGGTPDQVILWDIRNPSLPRRLAVLVGRSKTFWSVALSADGRLALAGNGAGAAILWDVHDPLHARQQIIPTRGVYSMALTPNGHLALIEDFDNRISIWDVSDAARPQHLADLTVPTRTNGLITAGFSLIASSPDGKTIVTASEDGTTVIWDISDPKVPHQLTILSYRVFTVAFSPDGHTLLTTGYEAGGTIWDIRDPAHPRGLGTLTASLPKTYSAAYSPDGNTVLTTSKDNTLRVWDLHDPAHPYLIGTIAGKTHSVSSIAFGSGGHVALAGSVSSVVLWDLTREIAIAENPTDEACTIVGRGLNREEWAQYLPRLAYENTCAS